MKKPRKPKKPASPLVKRVVDNPYYNPAQPEGVDGNDKKSPAIVDIRESAIETLYGRNQLSRMEKAGADEFRRLWETYAKANISAFDYSADRVSSGGRGGPVTEAQIAAREQLARIKRQIGVRGFDLLSKIAGQGMSLADVGKTNRERTTAADNLRTHLYDVAGILGLWGRSSAKPGKVVGERTEKAQWDSNKTEVQR